MTEEIQRPATEGQRAAMRRQGIVIPFACSYEQADRLIKARVQPLKDELDRRGSLWARWRWARHKSST